MSADRRIVFEITGDAKGWAVAVKDAQNLNQQAVGNAQQLNGQLARLDDERVAHFESSMKLAAKALLGFEVLSQVQKSLESAQHAFADYGHALVSTAELMNTTVQNAAVLRYTFESLGLDADQGAKMIATLTRNMQHNSDEFAALGVQTRDAQGHLRNVYDVITDLQGVVSAAGNDNDKLATTMLTVARAAGAGGESIAALEKFLSLTKEQMDANRAAAEKLGMVYSDETAKKADDLWVAQKALEESQKANALAISQQLAPAFEQLNVLQMEAIEITRTYGAALLDLLKIVAAASPLGLLHTILTGEGSVGDQLAQFQSDFMNAPTWDAIQAKVQDQIRQARLAVEQNSGDKKLTGPGSGGGDQGLRDRQQALRDQLAAFQEEKQAAIDAINEERQARTDAWNDQMEQMRQAEDDRKRAHQDAIDAINDESARLEEQFALRARARDDQIAALRDQIALLDQQLQIENEQDQLARDQRALRQTESEGPVTMRRGEHLEDYYKRVHEQEAKLVDEKKKVEDDKEKIARDAQKRALEDQIKSIEAIARADQRTLEDEKKIAAGRIKDIEDIQKAEERRTTDAIQGIRDEMKEAERAAKVKIKGLQDEMKAEKDLITDQIKGLDDLLKKHQSFTGGVVKNLADQQSAADATAAAFQRLNAAIANVHNTARDPDAATANEGTTNTGSTTPKDPRYYGGAGGTISPRPGIDWGAIVRGAIPFGLGGLFTETHAAGGSIYLTQPAAIVGMGGRSLAVAGAGETINITPRAGARGGGREVHVHVYGLTPEEATRRVVSGVMQALEVEDAIANASGAVRRS